MAQAIARVFARLGEKQNRNRARIKFLVAKLGIDEFRRLVDEERAMLPHDDRWTAYLPHVDDFTETPRPRGRCRSRATAPATPRASTSGSAPTSTASASRATPSRRSRCRSATSAPSRRAGSPTSPAATPATPCARPSSRTSCCAGSPRRDLPALYADLAAHRPRRARARGRSSTSPPAPAPTPASSASPRRAGWPASCARASARAQFELDEAVRGLRIKVSGCFNSCGQHHVADIGFFGISRKIDGVHRAALPGRARRAVARERRLLRPGDRRGPVEAHPRGRRRHHRRATWPSATASETFQDFIARARQEGARAR